MSGADEESSTETTLNPKPALTSSKKGSKTAKRKSGTSTISRGPSLSGDNGYGSGGSQSGYVSGGSQGGCGGGAPSQMGYISSGYDDGDYAGLGVEEISRMRLSDPSDMTATSGGHMTHGRPPVSSHHHMQSSSMGGGAYHFQSPPYHHSPLSPASQQYMAPPPALIHHTPSSVATSNSTNPTSRPLIPGETPSSAHHSANNGDFMTMVSRSRHNPTPSSGYSSFRSEKSPDEMDRASVVSSGLRSNIHSMSHSTFSSTSSRVSSPSSGSNDRGTSLFPPTTTAAAHLLGGGGGGASSAEGDFKHTSLRISNSYPRHQQDHAHHNNSSMRRHSDEMSNSSRGWTYSSQSSRYSYSGSELSDEVLESLPTDLTRRDSFSKNSPLPLPESMQQQQAGMGLGGMEFGNGDQHSGGGMGGFSQSHSQQNGFMDHTCSTLPLRHYGNSGGGSTFSSQGSHGSGGVFSSQDSSHLSGDGYEAYINRMHYMSPSNSIVSPGSNNMVIGNMESFSQTLSEETQYYETVYHQQGQMSNAQVK